MSGAWRNMAVVISELYMLVEYQRVVNPRTVHWSWAACRRFWWKLTCYILLISLHPTEGDFARVNSALADSEKSKGLLCGITCPVYTRLSVLLNDATSLRSPSQLLQ